VSVRAAHIPMVIGLEIFSFLYVQDWGQLAHVCKNWHHITTQDLLWNRLDLKNCFSSLAIINGSNWKALGLNVTDEPAQKKIIVKTLRRLFAHPGIKQTDSTLLTIPKGLSLNKLLRCANAAKQGSPIRIRYCCVDLGKQLKAIRAEKTHRVFITNEIVRSTDVYKQGLGCKGGRVLAGAALLALTYVNSSRPLFYDTHMSCSDEFGGKKILVGNWRVLSDQCSFEITHHNCFMLNDSRVNLEDTFRYLEKNTGSVVLREF
jgi:hypothetical protein